MAHVGAVAEIQQMAGRLSEDRVFAAQHAAQVRDVPLQCVARGQGRGRTPDHVDQPVDAGDLAISQRKGSQHRFAPQPVQRPQLAIEDNIDRPKKPHQHRMTPRRSANAKTNLSRVGRSECGEKADRSFRPAPLGRLFSEPRPAG
jgi:hypothetical protein